MAPSASNAFRRFVPETFGQCVVERTKVGRQLLLQISGQEP